MESYSAVYMCSFFQHVQEEKARIEQRYLKLQNTMRSLQDEIQSANFCGAKVTTGTFTYC